MLLFMISHQLNWNRVSDPCPPPSQSHVPKYDGGHGVYTHLYVNLDIYMTSSK
jgi:hypothetical protein